MSADASTQSVALVDLYNVNPHPRTRSDYEEVFDLIADLIRRVLVPVQIPGNIHEVECRLYGGFMDRNGSPTEQFTSTSRQVRRLNGLADNVRIIPRITRSLAFQPNSVLRGTFKNHGQKMVDGMLGHDAHFFARSGLYSNILIISDDDDFVPSVLTIVADTETPVRWLRRRPIGENDRLFTTSQVTFLYDGAWS